MTDKQIDRAMLTASRRYIYDTVLELKSEGKLNSTSEKALLRDLLTQAYKREFMPPKEYIAKYLTKEMICQAR